jgi:hypothetical protein
MILRICPLNRYPAMVINTKQTPSLASWRGSRQHSDGLESEAIRNPLRPCGFIACLLLLIAPTGAAPGGMWDPLPMTVHEWGVNTFDWDVDHPLVQELPEFLYTDKKPGELIAKPETPVRNLPADSGVRTKPILYFYTPGKFSFENPPQVAAEMRFAFGHANAWWPQVNQYRTAEMTQAAAPPDWNAWKQKALAEYEQRVKGRGSDPDSVSRWNAKLAAYKKLEGPAQVAWLANRLRWYAAPEFPVDQRMQLVWDRLTLHASVPEGQSLPGQPLPADHWVKVAREVDAAYVSNGKQTERYLFYEGKTCEQPAIAMLPPGAAGPTWATWGEAQSSEVAIVNVGDYPIYDVMAIYRDRQRGVLWTGYVPMLPALPAERRQVDQVMALRVPDFDRPDNDDNIKLNAATFEQRTRGRLLENLTAGYHYDYGGVTMRDPADPQPPTTMHQLFKKEAVALEKIWHDDFFASEGLTVLYRESPAYLDEAMPLNIYTSMFWYIKLSRCGLVLNRNLPIDKVKEVHRALRHFESAQYNPTSEQELAVHVKLLKENRLLTMGMAKHLFRNSVGNVDWQRTQMLEKVKALWDSSLPSAADFRRIPNPF